MSSLLEQIKLRRLALGYRQSDMLMRIGISRQQYQRLEARGNPRLDTLELIAKGLNAELMLIPSEKRAAVQALLAGSESSFPAKHGTVTGDSDSADDLVDNPWKGLLGDSE